MMRRRDLGSAAGGWRRGVVLLLSLVLLFWEVSGVSAAESPSLVDPHAIGCILPLSGRNAVYGNRALDAVLLAAGVFSTKQTPLRVLIEDSRSDSVAAGAAVERLARAGVICILGPLGGQEALEAAKAAQRLSVPILTLTQREEITGVGDHVFRNFLTAAMQVRTVVQYARVDLGLRRFAIFYPDDPYGQEMVRLFRRQVRRSGGEIRKEMAYKTDQADFGEEIRALGSLPPVPPGLAAVENLPRPRPDFEALFIPDSYLRVAMIAPQLVYHDIKGIRLLGTSGWNSPELLNVDAEHLQGAVFVDGFFSDSHRTEVIAFVDTFYAACGREPDVMEALVHDAAGMVVKLLTENRGGTREAFRRNLSQVRDYPGLTGKTSFSPVRDAEKELFLLTVEDGRIVEVK